MNRREFLQPKRMAASAGAVLGTLTDVDEVTGPCGTAEVAFVRATRRAMATTFEVVLPFGTRDAASAAEVALDEIDRVEASLSAYRDYSEISRLNRKAIKNPVRVREELFKLLDTCRRLNDETDGAFDISAGPLIKSWGFFRRRPRLPTADEVAAAVSCAGMRLVELDHARRTVKFIREGVELNLGSIGKGYALDRAAACFDSWGVRSALLQGGRSSVYALGVPPGSPRGWMIGIRHPWDAEKSLGKVWLRDRGLATSAASYQNVEARGRRMGHIIDPRTGWPAEGMSSATVLAPTAAEADALATAFFIQGMDWCREYCGRNPEVSAVLLADDAEDPVVLNLGVGDFDGWPGCSASRRKTTIT
jgi:thiamine biosynthesis lipoprotein